MYEFVVCLIAGLGAGLGTGFAGMSAAAVIAPMLVAFLDTDPYMAVGIALASDVLASAASAYTYRKNNNIDVKNGIVMMLCVLVFTVVGSFAASLLPSSAMGGFSTFITMLLGVRFIVKPVMTEKAARGNISREQQIKQSVLFGCMIGFICGFVGAGGGMMMLFILTLVLNYELKTAVGTSVFIMAFTALTGAISHFAIDSMPDFKLLAPCVLFTLIFASIASKIANKSDAKVLNRVMGVILLILGSLMIYVKLLGY